MTPIPHVDRLSIDARVKLLIRRMPKQTAAAESRHPARRLAATVTAAALLAAGLGVSLGRAAGAAPIDDKKKLAAALEADINANGEKLGVLYEMIKAAQDKLDAAAQTITDAQGRITAAQQETDGLVVLVRHRAASVYRSASGGGGDVGIFDTDVSKLATRQKYASAASSRDDSIMQRLIAARAELRARQADAEQARKAAESEKAALQASTADFQAAQSERQRLLGQVQGDIKTLVDQAAQVRAAAQAPKGRGGSTFNPGELPPVSGAAGTAVNFAKAQVGKPYVYAASGPDAYDCSGLTMASWNAAGVSLPHNSEAQYNSLPHVPLDQLAPGDIVWYTGHVGIYVGSNVVIHASSSHASVVYASLGSSPWQGGARPG